MSDDADTTARASARLFARRRAQVSTTISTASNPNTTAVKIGRVSPSSACCAGTPIWAAKRSPVSLASTVKPTVTNDSSSTHHPSARRQEERSAITSTPSRVSGMNTTAACTTSGCSGIPLIVSGM